MKPGIEIVKGNNDEVSEIIAPSLVVQKGRGRLAGEMDRGLHY